MKLFRLSTYRLFRPSVFGYHKKMSDPFKVMVMSDLHFSYQVTDQKTGCHRETSQKPCAEVYSYAR